MTQRVTLVLCVALLLIAFWLDLISPQTLVAAILLAVPVALSSLVLDRRITGGMIAAALAADMIAGYLNGLREGHHWDTVAIANRALAGFSILLVGLLGAAAQSAAGRSGRLAAEQRQAQQEQALRRSMEIIRASLNIDLVARAIVREAITALDASHARLYASENNVLAATTFSLDRNAEHVKVGRERPPAEMLSLLRLAMGERRVVSISPTDAVGRYALATTQAQRALLVPLINDQITFGVLLLVVSGASPLSPETERLVQMFADQATVAAAQASLFVELAKRHSALKSANETLAHRGEVIRDLVYALSHDLRTPLTAAAMTMQQALDGRYGPLPEVYREILRRSIGANDELRRLAETLLLVARYESGDQSKDRDLVHVEAVVASVVNELEPMWRMKHIDCRADGTADAIVLGDQGELRRAVMNLVANAINWTPRDGVIWARAKTAGDRVVVSVEDSGYGISAAEKDRLFERLAQGDGSRQGGGSHLGLYIVRRIAESHGGDARYQPNQPTGSIFILDLPAAQIKMGAASVPPRG